LIESLRIENWVIVEAADLEFGPGLNVLTGETGTGKSIVLGALALLAGGRGSADAVRTGADRAVLEAVFAPAGELTEELSRRELDTDGEGLIVQRTLVPGGRSRVRVAGERVPASTLSELLADQIEISSQHSSQGLLRPEIQGRLVDESGGLLPLRAEIGASLERLRSLDADLATLRGESEERVRQQDFLAYQLAEIDEVGLAPGEIAELESARARLAHADRIANEGRAACAALVGAEAVDELPNAIDRLAEAIRWVEGLAVVDPALAELATRLRAQESELFEAARDLERYLQRIDSDPARLGEVEDRLAAIRQLQRKYGNSEQEIAASRERIVQDLAAAEGADERIEALVEERAERVEVLARRVAELSRGRAEGARKLARRVQAEFASLAMSGARFEARLEPLEPPPDLPCRPSGAERAEFLFTANKGEPPRSLRMVASGGELSRVFLAVRNALRKSGAGRVLVFDEVDAGIGGRVAERVGRALLELAAHHQVICITHLPQIAAFGDVHFRVTKRSRKGQTRAEIERIEGEPRVEEIARMAGGEKVTPATRRHATELLGAKSNTLG